MKNLWAVAVSVLIAVAAYDLVFPIVSGLSPILTRVVIALLAWGGVHLVLTLQRVRLARAHNDLIDSAQQREHELVHETLVAVHNAEARWRAVFDASPVAILLVAHNGILEDWNRAARELLGYGEQARVVGQPVAAVLPGVRTTMAMGSGGVVLADFIGAPGPVLGRGPTGSPTELVLRVGCTTLDDGPRYTLFLQRRADEAQSLPVFVGGLRVAMR